AIRAPLHGPCRCIIARWRRPSGQSATPAAEEGSATLSASSARSSGCSDIPLSHKSRIPGLDSAAMLCRDGAQRRFLRLADADVTLPALVLEFEVLDGNRVSAAGVCR